MSETENAQVVWEEQLLSSFLDMVRAKDGDFTVLAKLGAATKDQKSLVLMMQKLLTEDGVKEAFQRRALLGETDFASLHQLPNHTFGYLYADHMLGNNLKQLNVKSPSDITDDYSYLAAHLGETHDIWHVISDSDTSIFGEIKVAAFSAAQIHTSRLWFALMAKNILKAAVYEVEVATTYLDVMTQGWLMGRQAKSIFGVDWREHWATPIDELRGAFNVVV